MFSVYRVFDQVSQLLYIGSTADFFRRMQAHHGSTAWMTEQVARIDIAWFPTIEAARMEEARAIYTEHPLYNRYLQDRKFGGRLRGDRICPRCRERTRQGSKAYCQPCERETQAAYRLARKVTPV